MRDVQFHLLPDTGRKLLALLMMSSLEIWMRDLSIFVIWKTGKPRFLQVLRNRASLQRNLRKRLWLQRQWFLWRIFTDHISRREEQGLQLLKKRDWSRWQ